MSTEEDKGDYAKWTISALKTACRKLYKEDEKSQKEIEAQNTDQLAKTVLLKMGVQPVKYHLWTKDNLKSEVERLNLKATGTKAALIAAITKHNNTQNEKKDATKKQIKDATGDAVEVKNITSKRAKDADNTTSSEGEQEETKKTVKRKKDDSSEEEEEQEQKPQKKNKLSDAIPSSPTKSILKPASPARRTRMGSPKSSPGSKLKFGAVEVRQYARRHGGGGGVPHHGGFPLGLDWEYDKDHVLKRGLTDYEDMRKEDRHEKGAIPAVGEKERQALLENTDDRSHVVRASSFMRQRNDLDKLRKVRKDIGCDCEGAECGTSNCLCNKSGVECLEDYCSCTSCENPQNL